MKRPSGDQLVGVISPPIVAHDEFRLLCAAGELLIDADPDRSGESERDPLPVGGPQREVGAQCREGGKPRRRPAPHQIEQPQIGISRVARVGHDRHHVRVRRRQRDTAERAGSGHAPGDIALPIEPLDREFGIRGAIDERVAGGGEEGAIEIHAHPFGHRYGVARDHAPFGIERLRDQVALLNVEQASRAGRRGAGRRSSRPRTASAAACLALRARHPATRCRCHSNSACHAMPEDR